MSSPSPRPRSGLRGLRSAPRTLAAGAIGVIAALSMTLVTGMAAPSFFMTLAGPSIAPMYPSGLVWDANLSRLIVADTGYNRISVFQAPNWQTPTLQFGALGTNPGQFNTPRQVAVDASSNIYVADAGNSRLESFTSNGTFRWATPSGGKLQSSLNVAIGVTYDFVNHVVLVADTGHSVVKAFDSGGNFKWASPTGMLASPRDAIRGPDGHIWVADYNHEEVKAFTVSADGLTWNTTPAIVLGDGAPNGHGLGQLNAPYNVQFSLDGKTAYVADTGNERIARWNISGSSPVALSPAFGARCPKICPPPPGNAGYFNALRRVAVDTSGNIWAADFWGSGVHEFSSGGSPMTEIDGSPAGAPGFGEAMGIAVGGDGMTYGVDLLNQRVERFNAAGTYLNSVGFRGTAPGRFSWPETVAVAPDGTVWVGDTRNNRLQHFSADLSSVLSVVGSKGSALGQFNHMEGIAVDGSGVVWVADTVNNRIESYDPSTTTFTAFGTRGTSNGQLINPQGVAVSATDVYVADTGNNRVEKFSLTGTYEASFSTGLNGPQGIALAPDGSVWVADTMNNRVVHLTSSLTDLGDGFGSAGTGNMQFNLPHSLAVHGSVLFVADTFNNRVQEFNI